MERKKIMTWTLTWLNVCNVSASALNVTLQLLIIYRYIDWQGHLAWRFKS